MLDRWLNTWTDPGPCVVDQAPHTTCCAPAYDGTIAIVQLPNRDAVAPPPLVGAVAAVPRVGETAAPTIGFDRASTPSPPRRPTRRPR